MTAELLVLVPLSILAVGLWSSAAISRTSRNMAIGLEEAELLIRKAQVYVWNKRRR